MFIKFNFTTHFFYTYSYIHYGDWLLNKVLHYYFHHIMYVYLIQSWHSWRVPTTILCVLKLFRGTTREATQDRVLVLNTNAAHFSQSVTIFVYKGRGLGLRHYRWLLTDFFFCYHSVTLYFYSLILAYRKCRYADTKADTNCRYVKTKEDINYHSSCLISQGVWINAIMRSVMLWSHVGNFSIPLRYYI